MGAVLMESPGSKTGNEFNGQDSFKVGDQPTILTGIYEDNINIAIWRRSFSEELTDAVNQFISVNQNVRKSMTLSPKTAYTELENATNGTAPKLLLENMVELVDMFCCLFDLKEAGFRLAVLDDAMCPRFHVDQVPCRLVTTYQGIATQWLPNDVIDRSKLGRGSHGQSDSMSGLYIQESNIQQLACGDVALLKGERWSGNESRGLVHRSPTLLSDERRLLLTLDFG
ncbi:DUF1826 domain-containing protein [Vibrio genomosp. F10]|uniref:Succinylglutamate desuccinylase n=1 Tax=Vibrio genomosp. F10 TaxID=723171 RepID=A0A1B9QZ27_9VIBR|nr:DUF1826 domain-containing protein [Vibrio genomosp. F10]OCH76055.1 succinylglutamate desuccinylase [Vibrio genomosp. F10]